MRYVKELRVAGEEVKCWGSEVDLSLLFPHYYYLPSLLVMVQADYKQGIVNIYNNYAIMLSCCLDS